MSPTLFKRDMFVFGFPYMWKIKQSDFWDRTSFHLSPIKNEAGKYIRKFMKYLSSLVLDFLQPGFLYKKYI